jgi:dihydrofolate reductase
MAKIIITEYVSVDGVIEAPGGTESFRHVNWAMEYTRGPEADAFKFEETRASAALLLGRITYEGFAESWPHMEGEFADMFNAMPKYVVSSTLTDPSWNNTHVIGFEAVRDLRARPGGDLVVHGSSQLAQALIEADLVDEIRLLVYPVVLGDGKRLFGPTTDKKPLRLKDCRTFGDGITLLTYEPAAG